jgi:hypothetical protein
LRWTIGQLLAARQSAVLVEAEAEPVRRVAEVVRVQAPERRAALAEAVRVQLLLLRAVVPLLLLFRPRPVRLLRVVAEDKPVPVAVVRAVVEVAAATEADRLWPVVVFAPAPQFPAWRLSMRCSQRAPIPTWHSARAALKPAPAVVSAIRCSVQEPRRCIAPQ